MIYVDTKRLPLLHGQKVTSPSDYLCVAMDNFSREPYAAILLDQTSLGAAKFLREQVIEPCLYLIECVYSDNGGEYKGVAYHALAVACFEHGINQKFTQSARLQTNGKAERVIRTLMEMWHNKQVLIDSGIGKRGCVVKKLVIFYHTVRSHGGLNGDALFEVLLAYCS